MPTITVRDDNNTLLSFVDGKKIAYQIAAEDYFKDSTYLAIDLDGKVVWQYNCLTNREAFVDPEKQQILTTCLQEIAAIKEIDR